MSLAAETIDVLAGNVPLGDVVGEPLADVIPLRRCYCCRRGVGVGALHVGDTSLCGRCTEHTLRCAVDAHRKPD